MWEYTYTTTGGYMHYVYFSDSTSCESIVYEFKEKIN